MPKIVIEADTKEEILEILIDLGIAQLNLRQIAANQQHNQSNCEQVSPEETPTFDHTDQK